MRLLHKVLIQTHRANIRSTVTLRQAIAQATLAPVTGCGGPASCQNLVCYEAI